MANCEWTTPPTFTWQEVLTRKISELELLASWASLTGFGVVRDSCRTAQAELRRELERLQAIDKEA